jgi:hypothetical protein
MLFAVFMIILWGLALFHRHEHRQLPAALASIDRNGIYTIGSKIDGQDWRVIADTPDKLVIKRAFEPVGTAGKLRYAIPVFALALMMILLQSIPTTILYLGFLYLRWFILRIEIEKGAEPTFHVLVGAHQIYEDRIP